MEQETIDLVKDKKFTEFSKAVKHELKTKLSNHPVITKHLSDFEKIQQMKDKFAEITQTNTHDDSDDD